MKLITGETVDMTVSRFVRVMVTDFGVDFFDAIAVTYLTDQFTNIVEFEEFFGPTDRAGLIQRAYRALSNIRSIVNQHLSYAPVEGLLALPQSANFIPYIQPPN